MLPWVKQPTHFPWCHLTQPSSDLTSLFCCSVLSLIPFYLLCESESVPVWKPSTTRSVCPHVYVCLACVSGPASVDRHRQHHLGRKAGTVQKPFTPLHGLKSPAPSDPNWPSQQRASQTSLFIKEHPYLVCSVHGEYQFIKFLSTYSCCYQQMITITHM